MFILQYPSVRSDFPEMVLSGMTINAEKLAQVHFARSFSIVALRLFDASNSSLDKPFHPRSIASPCFNRNFHYYYCSICKTEHDNSLTRLLLHFNKNTKRCNEEHLRKMLIKPLLKNSYDINHSFNMK